ncbi:putative nuclease HARBI1 [Patella vulgata]|uniref:putative nuclease HARBI1 n=1 Tax=Patella vulgata TaxID=6465 RepID=UPI0024A9DC89|nr:putative nuclease HARBI1 [Patella vulgata]
MAANLLFMIDELLVEEDYEDNKDTFDIVSAFALAASLIRENRVRIKGYMESIVPEYSEVNFKRMYRVSSSSFEVLTNHLRDYPKFVIKGKGGREPISVEKQLLITLWYLGSKDTVHKISDRFGISESTMLNCRDRVLAVSIVHLMDKFITLPVGNELQAVKDRFEWRNGFSGIVGCLDGTHIRITSPKHNPKSYVNRKGFHSIQLQAVCREDMRFIDCFVGFPGSCHDSRILRNSDLFSKGPEYCQEGHILADGGYPLLNWLMTPYRDNGHLTANQRNFNTLLSSNRVIIERAFGILKGRFSRLQYLDTTKIETSVKIIMTCCIFHNICILNADSVDEFFGCDEDLPSLQVNTADPDAVGARLKRDNLARNLQR